MGFKYFDGVKTKKAQKKVVQGGRPELSDEVKDSNDPSIRAILKAMELSQKQKASDRSTAREISEYLSDALKEVKVKDH